MCFSSKNCIISYWTQPTFMGWGKSRNPCKRLRLGANGQSDCVYWADVLRGYSISLWYKQQEQQQWQAEELRPVNVVGCWPFFQLLPLKNGRPPTHESRTFVGYWLKKTPNMHWPYMMDSGPVLPTCWVASKWQANSIPRVVRIFPRQEPHLSRCAGGCFLSKLT